VSANYNSKYFKVLIKLVILEVSRSSRISQHRRYVWFKARWYIKNTWNVVLKT